MSEHIFTDKITIATGTASSDPDVQITPQGMFFTETEKGVTWEMNTDGASIKFYNTGDGDTNSRLEFNVRDNANEYFRWTNTDGNGTYELMKLLPNDATNGLTFRGNKVWHAGNDGSSSGLDADTVDTLHASQFLRSDTSDTTTGSLTVNGTLYVDDLSVPTLTVETLFIDSKLELSSGAFVRAGDGDLPQYSFVTSTTTGLRKDSSHNLHLVRTGSNKLTITNTSVSIPADTYMLSNVVMSNLPTSQPSTKGQLWNSGGVVKIAP